MKATTATVTAIAISLLGVCALSDDGSDSGTRRRWRRDQEEGVGLQGTKGGGTKGDATSSAEKKPVPSSKRGKRITKIAEDVYERKPVTIHFLQPDGEVLAEEADDTQATTLLKPRVDDVVMALQSNDRKGMMAILDVDIYDLDGTTPIGHTSGVCTRIAPRSKWYCTGTYEFQLDPMSAKNQYPSDHSVAISGPFYDNTPLWNAVLGGTGAFEGVTGQAHYDPEFVPGWNNVTMYLKWKDSE